MEVNSNRIINISSTNSADSEKVDWHYFLSNLLTGKDSSGANIVNASNLENLIVNPSVYLLMKDETPEFNTGNSFPSGLKNIISGATGNNKYGGLVKNLFTLGTSALDALTQGEGEVSDQWNPWFANVPTWNSSKGISFPYTFSFNMGQYGLWNAKEEVVKPILNLIAPTLAREVGSFATKGPAPSVIDIMGDMIDILGSFGDGFKGLGDKIQNLVMRKYREFTYTVSFGSFLTLGDVLIENSKYKFSSEVDNNGMPIRGEVTLTFESIAPQALTTLYTTGGQQSVAQAIKFGGF